MKRILLSLCTIAAVAVMATGATSAYFSDSKVIENNRISTGTVTLSDAYVAPLSITGLYPGATGSSNTSIKYTGTINGDLYFGFQHASGGAVLGDELSFAIARVDGNTGAETFITGWVRADVPYSSWTKIASNLNQNETAYYKVYVQMDSDATNTGANGQSLQGQTALFDTIFYAVQAGGEAPQTAPINF